MLGEKRRVSSARRTAPDESELRLGTYRAASQAMSMLLWLSPHMLEALVPTEPIATRHTTIMSAIITAYSTAVGPSSSARNRVNQFMAHPVDHCTVNEGGSLRR